MSLARINDGKTFLKLKKNEIVGIFCHAMPKYIHHSVNHGKKNRFRIVSHTLIMDLVVYKDNVCRSTPILALGALS